MPLLYILSAVCQALLLTFFKNNHKNLKDYQSRCTANYKFHSSLSPLLLILSHIGVTSLVNLYQKSLEKTRIVVSRCHIRTYGAGGQPRPT